VIKSKYKKGSQWMQIESGTEIPLHEEIKQRVTIKNSLVIYQRKEYNVFKHLFNINDNTWMKLCKTNYVIALRNKIENHIKLPTFSKLTQKVTDITFSREELKVVGLGFE
jgi:hypothetical protein